MSRASQCQPGPGYMVVAQLIATAWGVEDGSPNESKDLVERGEIFSEFIGALNNPASTLRPGTIRILARVLYLPIKMAGGEGWLFIPHPYYYSSLPLTLGYPGRVVTRGVFFFCIGSPCSETFDGVGFSTSILKFHK